MLIRDLMTPAPSCCAPADTLDKVAKLMLDHDCGEIPVCDGNKLVGVITDRDIACRAVAMGKAPHSVPAREIMTHHVVTIGQDEKLDTALEVFERELVRRLPVVDHAGNVVGIVSLADLTVKAPTIKVARAMRHVAKKTRTHRVEV